MASFQRLLILFAIKKDKKSKKDKKVVQMDFTSPFSTILCQLFLKPCTADV